jgi:hypoxanthine-guanine phosphoribosyltransferase
MRLNIVETRANTFEATVKAAIAGNYDGKVVAKKCSEIDYSTDELLIPWCEKLPRRYHIPYGIEGIIREAFVRKFILGWNKYLLKYPPTENIYFFGCGKSGAMVLSEISRQLAKSKQKLPVLNGVSLYYMLIKKTGEHSHRDSDIYIHTSYKNCDFYLVDDFIDTGKTIKYLIESLLKFQFNRFRNTSSLPLVDYEDEWSNNIQYLEVHPYTRLKGIITSTYSRKVEDIIDILKSVEAKIEFLTLVDNDY